MAGQDGAERDVEDTGNLLYTDYLNMFGLDSLPLKLDHCDLLLDAMDAQLEQLQLQPPTRDVVSAEFNCSNAEKPVGRSVSRMETKQRLDRSDQEEAESRREQAIWRLERLLGDVCEEGTPSGETASDSICTEDFLRCFREEMMEPYSLEQLNREEEAGRTAIPDRDSDLMGDQNVERRGSPAADTPRCPGLNKPGQRKQQRRRLSDSCGADLPPAEDKSKTRHGDHGNCCPVRSSGSASADSDLDTVCTEQVRRYIHKWTGWHSEVTDLNDDNTDYDTPTQPEPPSISVRSSSTGRAQRRNLSARKTRKTPRYRTKTYSEETDEESVHSSRTSTPVEVSERQRQVGESKNRGGTLENMLAQKELQLSGLQDRCGSLQRERENLKMELRHLKYQQDKELKKAREQVRLMSVHKEAEEQKVDALKRENLSLTRHIESLNASIQLKRSENTVQRLERDVQLAVMERDGLQAALEERRSSYKRLTAEKERQLRRWAQQLEAECQHLHLLVEQNRAHQGGGELPQSFTAAKALPHLRTIRGQLKHVFRCLHQELDLQKQAHEQLRKEKEQELSIQRQQLMMDKDQALSSLRARLIKEHVEELSELKCAQASEAGGVAASLRRQLRDKDLELRRLQRNMAQWKRQTAARLALGFEDQLTSELERFKAKLITSRKASKTQEVRPEEETVHSTKEAQRAVFSQWPNPADSAAAHIPSDVASLKLLSYLQSKVKQLRVENQFVQGEDGAEAQSRTSWTASNAGSETSHSVNT